MLSCQFLDTGLLMASNDCSNNFEGEMALTVNYCTAGKEISYRNCNPIFYFDSSYPNLAQYCQNNLETGFNNTILC